MRPGRLSRRWFAFCSWMGVSALVFLTGIPASAEVVTINFEEFQPGQVVAGDLPGGGTAAPDLFPYVIFSVATRGRSHNSLVIFDSSDPTGGDYDLGTPNRDFSGPGLGRGGRRGTPGENAGSLGNVLVIAENIVDESPADGLVDRPDDNSGGGTITATFPFGVTVDGLTVLDMDDYSRGSWIKLHSDEALLYKRTISNLGNNSLQEITFAAYEDVTRVQVFFRGSGAITELRFRINPTAVEITTWGKVKSHYR